MCLHFLSENGVIKGGIGGVSLVSPAQKVWRVAQALGDIAFAYPFSLVLLEIEDTLRSPPAESETMKAASRASIAVTTFFYLVCGCFGYAAFGDDTPGNLLTGFGDPYWLVGLANLCVVLHLLGGYQVYAQPVFVCYEKRLRTRYPDATFFHRELVVRLLGRRGAPRRGAPPLRLLSLSLFPSSVAGSFPNRFFFFVLRFPNRWELNRNNL